MSETKKVRLTYYLTEEERTKVRGFAAKRGISLTDFAAKIILEYIENHDKD